MRKLTFYLILLVLAVLIGSCEIKAPSADDDDEDNFLHDPSPYDNEIGVSLQPMLNWIYNANSNNISFTIYMGTVNTQMDSIAYVNSNSYYITTPLEGNKTYYWQVRTIYDGNAYESNVWSFTTTASGGMILNNPNPPDNATGVSLTPQLSWQYNGTNSIFEYDIFMDTNYQANIYIGQVQNPYYLISTPLQSGKTYYWKIRAYSNNGTFESNVWRFTTTGSGGIINNPNPPDGDTGVSLTPQLSWQYNGSYNINSYEIYMDTYNPPITYLGQTPTPNYYISSPLQGGKVYYWKIRAYSNNGTFESNVWKFSTTGGLPTNGLMAYYPFNGNPNDESGNYNNGYNYGASLTYDRFNNSNKAYSFNGSSYIYVYNSTTIQPTDGLTLSAWVKFNNINNTSSILAKGSENSKGCYNIKYVPSSGNLDFQINFSDYVSGPRMTVSTSSTMQTNYWYNVIGIFDGNYMKIYLNGQIENSIYVPKSLGSNNEVLYFGSNAEANFLNGSLDDIRIYNRALNETEIQQLYNEGSGKKMSQLKHQNLKN